MTDPFRIAATGLIESAEILSTEAGNMTAAGVIAGRGSERFLTSLRNIGSQENKGSGGVIGRTQQNLSQIGSIRNVDNSMYCAAGNNGYFVTDKGFTRVGTWNFDKTGDLVNHFGHKLQAFEYNSNGDKIDPKNPNLVIGAAGTTTAPNSIYTTTINTNNLNLKAESTKNINFAYHLPDAGVNAGETITSQQTVYDSLGVAHNLKICFTRANLSGTPATINQANSPFLGGMVGSPTPINANNGTSSAWFVNVLASDTSGGDVIAPPFGSLNSPCLVEFDSSGTPLCFNGNSSLTSLPPVSIAWGNKATNSTINLNVGAIGSNSGVVSRGNIKQVGNVTVDGYSDGNFLSLQWDNSGNGIVTYTNGQQIMKYQMAMATFPATDELSYMGDGLYQSTAKSGNAIYGICGDGKIDNITPSALEESNVSELNTQVKVIKNQRYSGANGNVFRATIKFYEELDKWI